MRRLLLIAASIAALGAVGVAVAQDGPPHRAMDMLFSADANNDGAVTRQEFDAGRDAHFRQIDANNDNQLAHDEMRAAHGRHGGEHHLGGHRGGHRGGPGEHLDHADANNDGAITREEFLARPAQMFARLDADNNGVISQDERPQGRDRAGRHLHGSHDRLDSDGNGQLSREEFAAMGATMFGRLDANGDGRVTREEAEAHRPPPMNN